MCSQRTVELCSSDERQVVVGLIVVLAYKSAHRPVLFDADISGCRFYAKLVTLSRLHQGYSNLTAISMLLSLVVDQEMILLATEMVCVDT